MIIRGIIKQVGQTRDWTDRNGENRQSVKLTMAVPYVTKDGSEGCDEIEGEMTLPNGDYLTGLHRTCEAQEKCEFQVGFFLSDWTGRKIQNIKVFNITKML